MAKPKKKKSSGKKSKATNGWDVLINALDLTYELINSGNIIGALFLGLIAFGLILTIRMPTNELSPLLLGFVGVLGNMKTGYIILITALSVSLYANVNMYRTYKTEIKRLTNQRSELVHGLETGKLKTIKTHVSCNTDI